MTSPSPHPLRFRQMLTALAAAVGITLAWWHWRSGWTAALAVLAWGLALSAVVAPQAHAPVFHRMEWLIRKLLEGLSWLLLGAVFVAVFVPGRLVLLVRRRDTLEQRPDPRRPSYWDDLPPADANGFRRQF